MKLYQINVPMTDNKGLPYDLSIEEFERGLLANCGGFTRLPEAAGVWHDNESGKTYRDRIAVFQVACDEAGRRAIDYLLRELFDDQECFFVAEIGAASFVPGRKQFMEGSNV